MTEKWTNLIFRELDSDLIYNICKEYREKNQDQFLDLLEELNPKYKNPTELVKAITYNALHASIIEQYQIFNKEEY